MRILGIACLLIGLSLFGQDNQDNSNQPAQTAPASTAGKTGTSPPLIKSGAINFGADQKIVVQDGQLMQYGFRVFLPRTQLTEENNPQLRLTEFKRGANLEHTESAVVVVPNQTVTLNVAHSTVSLTGTMLIFDVSDFKMRRLQAMARVTPILEWTVDGNQKMAIKSKPVYLGNLRVAVVWTVILVLVIGLIITLLSMGTKGGPLAMIRGTDGRFSLSYLQMSAWTAAIGGMTFLYGLIRLEIPEIPTSCVVLMGLSLVTSGVSGYQGAPHDTKEQKSKVYHKARLAQFLCDMKDGVEVVSLARAQMLFWTVANIGLFIVKSYLDGVLWTVPWEMVWLMGMSQSGYLAPKLMSGTLSGMVTEAMVQQGAPGGQQPPQQQPPQQQPPQQPPVQQAAPTQQTAQTDQSKDAQS